MDSNNSLCLLLGFVVNSAFAWALHILGARNYIKIYYLYPDKFVCLSTPSRDTSFYSLKLIFTTTDRQYESSAVLFDNSLLVIEYTYLPIIVV